MDMLLEGAFWVALSQIMLVNIVLSGDNAVVIALACRNLPVQYRNPAVMVGSAGAIVLRIIFCVIVAWLLQIPYLKIAGALLLFWIGVKLITEDDEGEGDDGVAAKANLWGAIQTIIIADAVMSLDNAIAIAAAAEQAAKGDSFKAWTLIIIGLVITIPIIVFGSQIIMRIMQRYPIVILIGGESSTSLYLDSCLYAMKTINAIMRKSIMFAIRSPYLNSDTAPDTLLVTLACIAFKSPAGRKKPIEGLTISVTRAVTSFDAAAPIINAIARPITPKVFRKSKNSCNNDFFGGLEDSSAILSELVSEAYNKLSFSPIY